MEMMRETTLLLALIASAAFGQSAPKRVFVDPASRWISIHDSTGSGAPGEFSLDVMKSCPAVIALTDARESADYTVLISRSGVSSGSVLIYAGGSVVHSFKPGHSSTLRKVADAVCDFVGSRK
jgi:hypothetical protein